MSQDQINVGQDAFLDVFANLVGILIILVVVIGAQATVAWQTPADQQDHSAEMERLAKLKSRKLGEFNNLRLENGELRQKLAEEHAINRRLQQIRQQMLVGMEYKRRAIEDSTSQLNQMQQASLIAAAQVQELQSRIDQVRYEVSAVQQIQQPVEQTIVHYPTPIARTVFSDEVHFRIKHGRIVHVPLDDLVDLMKQSWRNHQEQIRRTDSWSNVVGPVEDFELHYLTETVSHSQYGSTTGVRLKRFELLPTRSQLGEVIDTALAEGSNFQHRLGRMIPGKTTVSLWVYPDGYGDLEKVQASLRRSGFQTACWPLKFDGLISGGPRGFRTTTN